MTASALRLLICKIDSLAKETGVREDFLCDRAHLMQIIFHISNCSKTIFPTHPDTVKDLVKTVIEILDYHAVALPIETGKYRNTWSEFVKSRAEWQSKEIKDFKLFCFTLVQKMTHTSEHHFKAQYLGEALGMIYGFADQNGIDIEAMITEKVNWLEENKNYY